MALQMSFDDDFGSTHASAYHRISSLTLLPDPKIASMEMEIYVDAAARAAAKTPLLKRHYVIEGNDFDTYFAPAVLDVVDQNPQERAYEFLKTLDEYDGASDV